MNDLYVMKVKISKWIIFFKIVLRIGTQKTK